MDFLTYHAESAAIRDIDPANDCLRYISDRFELTEEQRYWIAFLYSTCYCAPTVFYMYNEFPDFENVNVGRLQRWWDAHKKQTIFQTDRLRIKTGNKLVETFESYRDLIGDRLQGEYFSELQTGDEVKDYLLAYRELGNIRNVGRFTLFIYLEMISVLTNFRCRPDRIDWRFADNCRKGLAYSIGLDDTTDYQLLDREMDRIADELKGTSHPNIFNVETTLCAYKKYRHGKRYIGYYIDRQLAEIRKIKTLVTTGVAWRVMDEFRTETYKHLKHHEDLSNHRSLRNGQDLGNEATQGSSWLQPSSASWLVPLGD